MYGTFCCKGTRFSNKLKTLLARLQTCNSRHRCCQSTKEQGGQPSKRVRKHPNHQWPNKDSNHVDGANDALDVALATWQPKVRHNWASDDAGVVDDFICGALHQQDVWRIPADLAQVKVARFGSGNWIGGEIGHAKVSTVAGVFKDKFWDPEADKFWETLQLGLFIVRPAAIVKTQLRPKM